MTKIRKIIKKKGFFFEGKFEKNAFFNNLFIYLFSSTFFLTSKQNNIVISFFFFLPIYIYIFLYYLFFLKILLVMSYDIGENLKHSPNHVQGNKSLAPLDYITHAHNHL